MPPDDSLALRPRSSGEILDDAWRLFRADTAALLVLTCLFQVPAFSALLLLLAQPLPQSWVGQLLRPLTTALLLTLTGLGSGACQELFRRRAGGEVVTLSGCLAASLRRSVGHLTARASGLLGILLGLGCLLVPGLTLWAATTTLHAQLAGARTGSLGDVQPGREARFDPGKAGAVTLSRLPLLVLAVVNVVLLVQMGLWVAGNLGGLNVALLSYELSPANPVFLTAAALLSWMLLTPYFEASSFLLSLDTRVRQEGLDLLYRVQRAFGGTAVARVLGRSVLAVGLCVGLVAAALPSETVDNVRAVRADLTRIAGEVRQADPYPGGQRWLPGLERLAGQLEQGGQVGRQRYRWFRQGLEAFADRSQKDAIAVLESLAGRLELLEENLTPAPAAPCPSKEEIKGLLRPGPDAEDEEPRPGSRKARQERKQDERPAGKDGKREGDDAAAGQPRRQSETGLVGPVSGELGQTGFSILIGLFLAVLAAAAVLWWRQRKSRPAAGKTPAGKQVQVQDVAPPLPHERTPADLFRQAEDLARTGQYKEAVRSLYWAVLSLLHRQHLLRCETTRTNGEYVQQVRLASQAPPGLDEPFEQLTTRFDLIWYGEQSCTAAEYGICHELGDDIRALI